ncbi:MAG: hypothetical protein ACFFCO_11945 [Promethearchaeota archaeon]
MASGYTTTDALADSLPTVISSARQIREFEGVMPQLVDRVTLGEGIGLSWNEVSLAQLSAQLITETTLLDNPQQMSDTMLTVTPTVIGIETLLTDRVAARISKNAFAKTGGLVQNAIERKKDEDGITVLDGATTALCGAGSTLTSGHIAAGVYRITSNATEPGPKPIRCVLHGYQIKDLYDELVAGVGTYVTTEGPTATVFRSGWTLPIAGCEVYEDGNISIDSSTDDAKGGVFSQQAIVLVQGRTPRVETERKQIGGGATALFHYDEYAYGERSAGNWLYEICSDATAPTS